MAIHELKYLHNTTVEQMPRDKTLFLGTVSPMEAHGPHFPLGADMLQSEGFLKILAEKYQKDHPDWEIVMLPPICFGSDVLPHPGSLILPAELLEDLIYHYLKNFAWHKFENVYLMGFHGGIRHNVAIENAMEKIHKDFGVRYLYGLGRVGTALFISEKINELLITEGGLTEEQAARDQHGGAMETSLGLYLFPEAMNGLHKELPDRHMVHYTVGGEDGAKFIKKLVEFEPTKILGRILGVLNGFTGWQRIAAEELGYIGSPSLATKELGKKMAKLITDQMYDDLKSEMARPKSDDPRDGSAYNMGRSIGPGTLASKLIGTYRGPKRTSPIRDKHPMQIPELPKGKSVAEKKKAAPVKTVRLKTAAPKK